jgi:predicted O-methyltransferase YrrM
MSKQIRPLPWITDGANDFLLDKMKSGEIKSVLEFGSGASTIFISEYVDRIVSIEHDEGWYNTIKEIKEDRNLNSLECRLEPRPYHKVCEEYKNDKFDLVLIDGRDRVLCCKSSANLVRAGGYMMLDNDERSQYKEVHDILSKWEKNTFNQVGRDYTGWSAPHPWATTVWKNNQ